MTRTDLEIAYAWAAVLGPEERTVLLRYIAQALSTGRLRETAMVKLQWDGGEHYALLVPDPHSGVYVTVQECSP